MTTTTMAPVDTTTDEPNKIPFHIAGQALGLLKAPVKDKPGRFYYVFTLDLKQSGRSAFYGVPVKALAQELPTSVVIDGVTISLEDALTGKDSDPLETRRRAKGFQGNMTLDTLGVRTVTVKVSYAKNGGWNVKATVRRVNSVSPEDRRATQAKVQEDNLAALQALFSA